MPKLARIGPNTKEKTTINMKELYLKLMEVQRAVVGLLKDAQGNAGAYVSGNKVLGIIRPKMDELGLLLIPEVEDATFTRQDYQTLKGGKSEMFCGLKIKFTWVDTESGETLECKWASSGMNGFDKGYGSALTYGERYFLLKFFHVATDKDDVDAPRTVEEEMTLQQVIAYIGTLTTQEQLTEAWNTYSPYYKNDKTFKTAFAKRQKDVAYGTKS